MNINGLTSHEWKTFEDLLVKANDLQIEEMRNMMDKEHDKRVGDIQLIDVLEEIRQKEGYEAMLKAVKKFLEKQQKVKRK